MNLRANRRRRGRRAPPAGRRAGRRSTALPARRAASTSSRRGSTPKASFNEAFTSVDGSGRMAISTLVAGANGLANFVGDITYKGPLDDVDGGVKLSAQKSRHGDHLRRPHAAGRRLSPRHRSRHVRAWSANIAADSAALDPSMLAGVTQPLAAAAKTPIGPVASEHRQCDQPHRAQLQRRRQDPRRQFPRRRRGADHRCRHHRPGRRPRARLRRQRRDLLLAVGRPADRRQYRNGRRRAAERPGDAFASRAPARR